MRATEGITREIFAAMWRPVRESNPCRRRERGASRELRGRDNAFAFDREAEKPFGQNLKPKLLFGRYP